MIGAVGAAATIARAIFTHRAVEQLSAAPTAYIKANVHVGDEVDDKASGTQKARVKFGNVGLGPMHVHELKLCSETDDKCYSSVAEAFGPVIAAGQVTIPATSDNLLGKYEPPRAWKRGGLTTVASLYPTPTSKGTPENGFSKVWVDAVLSHVKAKKLHLEVKYDSGAPSSSPATAKMPLARTD